MKAISRMMLLCIAILLPSTGFAVMPVYTSSDSAEEVRPVGRLRTSRGIAAEGKQNRKALRERMQQGCSKKAKTERYVPPVGKKTLR